MSEKNNISWFENWFNSPFYHILYKNRDYTEAQIFMSNLAEYLKIPSKAKILDAACGKGRHAAFLSSNGFELTGFDLAPESIKEAQKLYGDLPNLHFFVHDIRNPFRLAYFDYVFNLFTSFGYFETDEENIQTIQSLAENLHSEGLLVIDFFNADKITKILPLSEQKNIDNIEFRIQKTFQNRFIIKDISFDVESESYFFQERVMAITEEDFKNYFRLAGLEIQVCFGSYALEPFDASTSERMIWVLKKVK